MAQAIDKVYPEESQDEERRQIKKEVGEYVTRKGAWAGRSAWQDAAVYQTTTKLRSGREVVSFQRALPLHSFWRTHGASSAFQKLMLKLATVLASEGGVERAFSDRARDVATLFRTKSFWSCSLPTCGTAS